MDIEPSMSKNQYWYRQLHCKPTPSEAQVGICSNIGGGPASASEPLGLPLVSLEN